MTFKPGQSGNPAGRPKGTREAITQSFLRDLDKLWQEHGEKAIKAALVKDPVQFVKMVASLVPKEMALTGENGGPILYQKIERVIVDHAANQNGPRVPTAVGA